MSSTPAPDPTPRPASRPHAGSAPAEALFARYRCVRDATERLAAPLTPEDCAAQSMPDASPVKWHLAHTSWFFETFVLEEALPGYRPFAAEYRVLFNSYYNAVGAQHPRPERGLLTRPSFEEVLAYRSHVDRHVVSWLEGGLAEPERIAVVELGLQHEQQHQELILTDVKHLLSRSPLRPAYRAGGAARDRASSPRPAPAPLFHRFEAGPRWIGSDGPGFHFDNEGPRHRQLLPAFELAARPVRQGEFAAFVEAGGYRDPAWWLSDGWAAARAEGWAAPLYWERHDGGWWVFTLDGLRPLDPDAPVCHVSFYEADAYARWAGARLPTELEWEVAATGAPVEGNFVETGRLHPQPLGPVEGEAGPARLFGDTWEWTASPYVAYPGYRPAAGALGEYNGKFMCNQIVLRGGSCVTPRDHVRATYRNFFPASARWQFTGLRLARDVR